MLSQPEQHLPSSKVVGLLEASALGYIGGMEGPLTKQIDGHPKGIGHIGGALAVILLAVWITL